MYDTACILTFRPVSRQEHCQARNWPCSLWTNFGLHQVVLLSVRPGYLAGPWVSNGETWREPMDLSQLGKETCCVEPSPSYLVVFVQVAGALRGTLCIRGKIVHDQQFPSRGDPFWSRSRSKFVHRVSFLALSYSLSNWHLLLDSSGDSQLAQDSPIEHPIRKHTTRLGRRP